MYMLHYGKVGSNVCQILHTISCNYTYFTLPTSTTHLTPPITQRDNNQKKKNKKFSFLIFAVAHSVINVNVNVHEI